MNTIRSRIRAFQDARQLMAAGVYPYFRPIHSEQDTEVRINGRTVLMLGSNSYLGLTNHPKVKEAAAEAVRRYGTGCAGSRFLNGTLSIHVELEERLAAFAGKPKALLFSTGFMANQGTISALVGRHDFVITDLLDHASIIDGARMCFGRKIKFNHNDMLDLRNKLNELPKNRGKLIVVDGVFSMDGDIANIPELVRICREFDALLMVDEAHSLGVLGPHGAGSVAHFGLSNEVDIIMGTFSKSLAAVGGFVAADDDIIHYLQHVSRPVMFSASPPPAVVGAVMAALDIMQSEPDRIERLWANTTRMRKGLHALGFSTGVSETPILPVLIGDFEKTFIFTQALLEAGVFVNPVVSPGVPEGRELLRVSLMATHTFEQIDRALDIFGQIGRKLGVI